MNMDYCLSELKALLSIDSPSGFTDKAADYLIGELTALGYAPEKTRKGGVFLLPRRRGQPACADGTRRHARRHDFHNQAERPHHDHTNRRPARRKLRSGELPHLLALLRRLQRHLAALQCVDPRERLLR